MIIYDITMDLPDQRKKLDLLVAIKRLEEQGYRPPIHCTYKSDIVDLEIALTRLLYEQNFDRCCTLLRNLCISSGMPIPDELDLKLLVLHLRDLVCKFPATCD